MTQNLAQAWELEPEKRPTFAASRDSLDLFRTQNPQWRRRKTFPRPSKNKWMPASTKSDIVIVIKTSEEGRETSRNNLWKEF